MQWEKIDLTCRLIASPRHEKWYVWIECVLNDLTLIRHTYMPFLSSSFLSSCHPFFAFYVYFYHLYLYCYFSKHSSWWRLLKTSLKTKNCCGQNLTLSQKLTKVLWDKIRFLDFASSCSASFNAKCWFFIRIPIDTGRKLNVHKTFRRRLNVLCAFNICPLSTGMTLLNGCA